MKDRKRLGITIDLKEEVMKYNSIAILIVPKRAVNTIKY